MMKRCKFRSGCTKAMTLLFIVIWYSCVGFSQDTSHVVKITRSWELPAVLQNISAIDYLSPGKFACLQDETGVIFIYDVESASIAKEILFGPAGNYQGLVVIRDKAYVACADGRILEISNINADTPGVKEYGTHLTVAENVNGLCFDRKNKRLLVTIRGTEDGNQHYKDIYAFNLATKTMAVKPVLRIDLTSRVFRRLRAKNMQTVFQPSDLDISPVSGQVYIIDGTKGQLLRMKLSETVKDLKQLDKAKFFRPEGITITPSGEIFIASKGEKDEPGRLLLVQIR